MDDVVNLRGHLCRVRDGLGFMTVTSIDVAMSTAAYSPFDLDRRQLANGSDGETIL
jgi:hypothetical protein